MGTQLGSPRQWGQIFQQLFDRSDAHIALIDLEGAVLAVNSAWLAFGAANKMPPNYQPVGENYLRLCETAAGRGRGDASAAMEAYVGLQEVLRTGRPKFTMVYTCHSPLVRRWFRMWVEPQTPEIPVVVIAHKFIGEKDAIATTEQTAVSIAGEPARKIDAVCRLPVAKSESLAYQIGVMTSYRGSLARNHNVLDRDY